MIMFYRKTSLNEAEQALNSLIPEKSKGRYNVGVFS
jgi:hypothetical protein